MKQIANNTPRRNKNLNSAARLFIFLVFILLFGAASCSTSGSAQAWSPGSGRQLGAAEAGTIRIDKNNDWDSVEAETRRLLLLLLADKGYKLPAPGTACDYVVDAVLIEREYMENWKTRRSLSAEIFIRKYSTEKTPPEAMPLAAGKALFSGGKSFSSSKTLHDALNLALSRALRALPRT